VIIPATPNPVNISGACLLVNDFTDDTEAAQYAANYEARCYRIDADGKQTLIYDPAEQD
jgi:hypothetical protein